MSVNLLNQYDVVIFDCDGVLIDINRLKCEAFGLAVNEYPAEIVDSFVIHCKETFGISRYVKFKEFFSDFANEAFQEQKYNRFLRTYSKICSQGYKDAELTPRCEQLLNHLYHLEKTLYVISGSDEAELNEVFTDRNLNKYFNGIFGSPKSKIEYTSHILEKHPYAKAVFIGDSFADMLAAQRNNIDFIYMYKFTMHSQAKDRQCRKGAKLTIRTLEDLFGG